MRKYFFVFLCIYNLSLNAQDSTQVSAKNQLEFSSGYSSGALKNLSLAPVSRYDYKGLNYQLKYTRTSKKDNLFEVQLDYLNSALKSDVIPILNINDYTKVVLNFSYLKRIYKTSRFTVQVGLQTQTNLSSFFQWNLYDFQQKLGVAGRFSFQIDKKQSLSSKLTLPFLMWRTSTFEENFYLLNRYQSVLWTAAYKYKLSNHFDLKINYNFNYDRLQIPNAYRELQHQINLGINFTF